MANITNYKQLLNKIENLKLEKKLDLSSGEDLSVGIMNLISIEEHLFFTHQKTKDDSYLTLLNEVRKMRTELLKEIIKDYEGEVWCISKHLLAASMRLMEVGTKKLKGGDQKQAKNLFENSYKLYTLFWGLNLASSGENIKQSKIQSVNLLNEQGKSSSISVFSKLNSLLQKTLDCCRE